MYIATGAPELPDGSVFVHYRAGCMYCGLAFIIKAVQGSEEAVWFRCPNCAHSDVDVDFGEELPAELYERFVNAWVVDRRLEQWASEEQVVAWMKLREKYAGASG